MKIRSLKVSELSDYISQSINYDPILQNIYVEGELSNFKIHSSGNVYFTLKDDFSKVRCIMFSDRYQNVDELQQIEEGDRILCKGTINYYRKEGYVSFVVQDIRHIGESLAYQRFLRLKEKLEAQGYFDPKHKMPIPKYPKKIGVVTSPTGAVIRDIYHVIQRRYPAVKILVFPAHVQGEGAIEEISEGVRYFDRCSVDIIMIARGGGSYEELSAFNSEEVAQAIFHSSTPIISAVGHETDFTIADLVADMRASTPSVAAEIAVPVLEDLKISLKNQKKTLNDSISRVISNKQQKLEYIENILAAHAPKRAIAGLKDRWGMKKKELDLSMLGLLNKKKEQLNKRSKVIFSKNPENLFDFGGALLYNRSGEKVDSINKISPSMELEVLVKDGSFTVKVMEIRNGI
ncbi:MAG: exodeoxyribonuclease VII large subunit [Peptostreptococcaceae bacterium]|nr:exodeoxyribonuclease VII large subunit [Peptostreptococcaceae bacterium]